MDSDPGLDPQASGTLWHLVAQVEGNRFQAAGWKERIVLMGKRRSEFRKDYNLRYFQ